MSLTIPVGMNRFFSCLSIFLPYKKIKSTVAGSVIHLALWGILDPALFLVQNRFISRAKLDGIWYSGDSPRHLQPWYNPIPYDHRFWALEGEETCLRLLRKFHFIHRFKSPVQCNGWDVVLSNGIVQKLLFNFRFKELVGTSRPLIFKPSFYHPLWIVHRSCICLKDIVTNPE